MQKMVINQKLLISNFLMSIIAINGRTKVLLWVHIFGNHVGLTGNYPFLTFNQLQAAAASEDQWGWGGFLTTLATPSFGRTLKPEQISAD